MIWLAYFLLFFAGIEYYPNNLSKAVVYQLLFVSLVCLPTILLPMPKVRLQVPDPNRITFMIWAGLALSLVAFICLLIDRAQQGIDYSQGVCYARGQMTRLGQLRVGVRSPFSFIGNLFGPSLFVSVALLLTQQVSRRQFWPAMCAAFASLMCLSVISASRSGILLFSGFALASLCVRIASGKSIPRIHIIDCLMALFMTACAAGFVLSVFNCRAVASNMSATEYKESFESFLGAKPDPSSTSNVPSGNLSDNLASESSLPAPKSSEVMPLAPGKRETDASAPQVPNLTQVPDTPAKTERSAEDQFGLVPGTRAASVADKASGLVGVTALYATHSLLTFAYVLSEPNLYGRVLFTYPTLMLSKVGLIEPPGLDWLLTGRFASLPGGLWYDFGLVGLIAGSLILGMTIWGALCLVRLRSANELVMGLSSMTILIALLSPIHSAIEFTSFPFACFMFLFLYSIVEVFRFFRKP